MSKAGLDNAWDAGSAGLGSAGSGKARRLLEMKQRGEPLAMLTAYDAPTARMEADAGVDVILVGDSLGTNFLGYESERDVRIEDILHHLRAVRRGAPGATLIADLPFATYDRETQAVDNARRLVGAGADIVKFEGARPEIARALRMAGIAVAAHLGLEPQHHEEKRLKGKTAAAARRLKSDAAAMDAAGAAIIILEMIPEELAARITRAVTAPTVGIGAGRGTDGQVLVITDVLGYTDAVFRHNHRFAEVGAAMRRAASDYVSAVRSRAFPARANVFPMPKDELALLDEAS